MSTEYRILTNTGWRSDGLTPILNGSDWTPPAAQLAGAVTIGTAQYTIPGANVIYLATNGNDGNAGTTIGAPKATLSAAITAVPVGGTIVVRAGEYRQVVASSVTKQLTIQSYPGEAVWFDGSDVVTEWTQEGGRWWAPYSVEFEHDDPLGLVDPAQNPMAAWKDGCWRDGVRLWQVASNPAAGQFSRDYDTDRLWVADNPNGHEMRAIARSRLLVLQGANSIVRGIGVRRYSGAVSSGSGATILVTAAGTGVTVENVHMYDCGELGINTSNAFVHATTIIRPHQLAYGGNLGSDNEFSNNLIRDANYKRYKIQPVAGAIKLTKQTNCVIKHNIIDNAYNSYSIWLDVSCYEPIIVGNLITNSKGAGIYVELTEGGIVANNWCYGAGQGYKAQYACSSYNAGAQKYWNNFVTNYTEYNFEIGGDARRNTVDQVNGHNIAWQQIPWYAHDIEIVNNIIGENANYFQIGGIPTNVTGMGLSRVEGNLSHGNISGGTAHDRLMRWYNNPGDVTYQTWSAANTARPGLGLARNALTATLNPDSTEAASYAATIGVPLPSDVAACLGCPAGYTAVGPILRKPLEVGA